MILNSMKKITEVQIQFYLLLKDFLNKSLPVFVQYLNNIHSFFVIIKKEESKPKENKFPPVTEKPKDFEPDLFKACEEGKLDSVQYLYEVAKVNTEATDYQGRTPLHIACEYGKLPFVQYLCEVAKVNAEARDKKGRTPLHIACYKNHLPIVQYLCEVQKVNTEATDKNGWTALHEACQKGHLPVVQYLCEVAKVNTDSEEIKEYLESIGVSE